ncbi:MAG: membrane protein insertion efficiency factor [Planctomycetes bacterium DG_23]|nr:MAG: membrane protein insertion efficiency factor [Planctomycetes bacterium DG_23]
MTRLLIFILRIYQATLSPIFGYQCRYVPTCSNYFIEALEKKGLVKGMLLGLWRLLRCNPFSKGGYDPVR